MTTTTSPSTTRTIKPRPLLAIGFAIAILEGFDLACYGVTVPSLLADPTLGITPALAGLIGSLTALGMLLGAAFGGITNHRFGPRRLLLVSATIFTIGMLLCAVAPITPLFALGRLLVGLGLGVVLPTLLAFVADLSLPDRRNRHVGIVMAGYAVGGVSAPLLGALLLPGESFRWIYAIGVIPALIVIPIAWRMLPESPAHLARTGRVAEAIAASNAMGLPEPTVSDPKAAKSKLGLAPLFAPGIRGTTILFWLMSFCGLLLVFGISTWLPTIMQAAGYPLGSALLQTAAMWVGAGVGVVIGGRIADAVGPQRVVVVAFLIGAAALVGMSMAPNVVLLFVLMLVSGFGFIGSQILINGFIVSRYPDDLRGNGLSWALSAGRPGAMVGPLLGAWVLTSGLPVQWNFYVFAIVGVVGALLTLAVPRQKAGAPTSQVSSKVSSAAP
jgi:AAHS family benzoate transporter-like MFS transporter